MLSQSIATILHTISPLYWSISIFLFVDAAAGLKCIQCRVIERNRHSTTLQSNACYRAKIPAVPCSNTTGQSHCITYQFRTLETKKMVFFWRKCGNKNEAEQKCKIHDISKVYAQQTDLYETVHRQSDKQSSTRTTVERMITPPGANDRDENRVETSSAKNGLHLVEVCVQGCDTDRCVPSGVSKTRLNCLVSLLYCIVIFFGYKWIKIF